MKGKHLFIVDELTLDSISDETVKETVEDLKTLNLYRLPYDRVSVRLPARCTCRPVADPTEWLKEDYGFRGGTLGFSRDRHGHLRPDLSPAHQCEFRNLNLLGEPIQIWMIHEGADPGWRPYEIPVNEIAKENGIRVRNDDELAAAKAIMNFLIVLLASKNAIKHTKHNTLARHNLGSAKKPGSTRAYEYVTTISVPPTDQLEDDTEHPPGRAKCAHLRRGHIRRQHYGPHRSFIKQVWIEPVFVNADRDFVSTRKAYNVSL